MKTFEDQVEEIAKALISDLNNKKYEIVFQGSQASFRGLPDLKLVQPDAGEAAPGFDPVAIANYLRDLGDRYNEDLEEPARNIIAETVNASNSLVEKFGETVESLSRTWHNKYGLQYETAFLVVSVKLFVCLAQKYQNIAQTNLLTGAITGNREVRRYVERQGGWENLGN